MGRWSSLLFFVRTAGHRLDTRCSDVNCCLDNRRNFHGCCNHGNCGVRDSDHRTASADKGKQKGWQIGRIGSTPVPAATMLLPVVTLAFPAVRDPSVAGTRWCPIAWGPFVAPATPVP